ncbi:hypothetical protein FQR65_LT06038 [Abscondita terminalis]|nr:hypothetical protein FQR65_LT06038 [Abscondita terminalis]
MGSNIVSLTDRAYMQQLQERILENYANDMNKRIAAREAAEMERVKNLVLSGRIPLDDAPPEMVDHPVRLIEMYCRKLIAERRAKIKVQTVYIPKRLYPDDTPDPPSGLSIENGHAFRGAEERLCHSPRAVLRVSDEEDVQRGFMFTDEEYVKLNLEGPLIQRLRNAQVFAFLNYRFSKFNEYLTNVQNLQNVKYIMAWTVLILAAIVIKYAALIDASTQTFGISPNLQKNLIEDKENIVPYDEYKSAISMEDLKLQKLKHQLLEILLHPDQSVPLVYVEEYPNPAAEENVDSNDYYNQLPEFQRTLDTNFNDVPFKRSRYYRKYPWKRQNSREAYDAENRYMCQPSKDDVFRLLVALHEARQGNSRTVNFCNRRRAATAVFTNIRFLGRRK